MTTSSVKWWCTNSQLVVRRKFPLQENVKKLPPDVFDKIDQLASPRLVESWEQDPCAALEDESLKKSDVPKVRASKVEVRGRTAHDLGVPAEAQLGTTPHFGPSIWQVLEQPSPPTVLPSSHCSPSAI